MKPLPSDLKQIEYNKLLKEREHASTDLKGALDRIDDYTDFTKVVKKKITYLNELISDLQVSYGLEFKDISHLELEDDPDE